MSVAGQGGELQSIADACLGDVLWDGAEPWPRRSPVLFPIVGRLNKDMLRVDGRAFQLGQHGFARDRRFEWKSRTPTNCGLVLVDDAETREMFPFPFQLELTYTVSSGALTVAYRLENTGVASFPAGLGAHPAFRWPLSAEVAPEAHLIAFDHVEPQPIRRLKGGLLDPAPRATPVVGRVLQLERGLFSEDALIFDRLASRSLRYSAPGVGALVLSWRGFAELGLWSKPDRGDFLCIEPWNGYADPVGFEGEFKDKPGVMHIAPGETIDCSWTLVVEAEGRPG
ncbi:MAG: aldose 1-epimerase family protein [Caulobacteraceae bacterium]